MNRPSYPLLFSAGLRAVRPLLTALSVLILSAVSVAAGFFVQGGVLLDANGNEFVMRGVNHPHAWYASRTPAALVDIASTGANCVRLVLSNGDRWTLNTAADVANLIAQCKANNLIAILEVHDTTGYASQAGSVPLSRAVDYFISIQSVLTGEENYVIINPGNEPLDNNWTASDWINLHSEAITRLRAAGFTHTLMVDAASWGQDWQNIMRDNAAAVFNHDPQRNVVFSVHMYDVYDNAATIESYFAAFVNANLPLLVGEFASDHGRSGNVDEATIMARAQAYGFGYIGWSWSGNSRQLSSLDICENFDPTQLTPWGNTLIHGPNGIAATSQPATVFGGQQSALAVTPTSLAFPSDATSSTVNVTSNVSWSVTDDQSWISVSPASGANNGSFTVNVTAHADPASRDGTVTVSGGGLTRTVNITQAGVSTATDMSIANIAMNFTAKGPNITASATVRVVDENGANVSGATINGTWSGTVTGNVSGITGGDGTATLSSASKRNGGTFTFTVTQVTATNHIYAPSLNVETADSITAP